MFLLSVLCWLGASAVTAGAAGRPERAARDGLAAYRAGDFAAALEAFGTAAQLRPRVPELLYDTGVSAYRLGDYDTARAMLRPAIGAATTPELAAAGHLALGNIGMREAQQLLQQDPTAAIPALESGIASFERALRVDPDYAAAANNLELARVLLDELRQQQQQQQQQQSPQQDSGEQDQQQQHEQQEGQQPEAAPRDDEGPTPPAPDSPEEQPAPAPPGGENERMDDLLARQIIAAEEANAELRRRRQLQLLPVQRDW